MSNRDELLELQALILNVQRDIINYMHAVNAEGSTPEFVRNTRNCIEGISRQLDCVETLYEQQVKALSEPV